MVKASPLRKSVVVFKVWRIAQINMCGGRGGGSMGEKHTTPGTNILNPL